MTIAPIFSLPASRARRAAQTSPKTDNIAECQSVCFPSAPHCPDSTPAGKTTSPEDVDIFRSGIEKQVKQAALRRLLHHFIHYLHAKIEVSEFRIDRNALNGVGGKTRTGDQSPAPFTHNNDVNIVIHAELAVRKELSYSVPLLFPKAHIQRVKRRNHWHTSRFFLRLELVRTFIAGVPVFTPARQAPELSAQRLRQQSEPISLAPRHPLLCYASGQCFRFQLQYSHLRS